MIYTDDFPGLSYNPVTGWLMRGGERAGCSRPDGYRQTSFRGKQYLDHILIWRIVTGKWCEKQIDHINGVRDDNRWENIREATNQENQSNRRARKDSSTGVKGVFPRGKRFRAAITVEWREIHLGYFDTIEEAELAYGAAAEKYQKEFKRK